MDLLGKVPHDGLRKKERTNVKRSPALIGVTAWSELGEISKRTPVLCTGLSIR